MTEAFVNWFVNMSASLHRLCVIFWSDNMAILALCCAAVSLTFVAPAPSRQSPELRLCVKPLRFRFLKPEVLLWCPPRQSIESSKMIKWHGITAMHNWHNWSGSFHRNWDRGRRNGAKHLRASALWRFHGVCRMFGMFHFFSVSFLSFFFVSIEMSQNAEIVQFSPHFSTPHTSLASWLAWAWVTRLLQRWHLSELHLCVVSFVLCFFRFIKKHQVLQSWNLARHSSDNPVLLVQQSSDLVERGRIRRFLNLRPLPEKHKRCDFSHWDHKIQ